jgi:hypothetical protein
MKGGAIEQPPARNPPRQMTRSNPDPRNPMIAIELSLLDCDNVESQMAQYPIPISITPQSYSR